MLDFLGNAGVRPYCCCCLQVAWIVVREGGLGASPLFLSRLTPNNPRLIRHPPSQTTASIQKPTVCFWLKNYGIICGARSNLTNQTVGPKNACVSHSLTLGLTRPYFLGIWPSPLGLVKSYAIGQARRVFGLPILLNTPILLGVSPRYSGPSC